MLPLTRTMVMERPLPQKLVDRLARELATPTRLSAREIDVLALYACGYQSPGIAELLVLSQHTILTHVARIRDKLGAKTVAHAVALALASGDLDAELVRK